MKILTACLLALTTTFSVFSFAGDVPEAQMLSKADLAGGILEGQPKHMYGENEAWSATVHKSVDEKFSFGLFSMNIVNEETNSKRYDNFKHNELMYFIEGRMTLTDDNGKVVSAGPGEFLFIPKGWSGMRVTTDISKVSVVYKDNPSK